MYNPDLHHRHSIRLRGWDYRSAALYFVTIVSHERELIFGEITDRVMALSPFGTIVEEEWLASPTVRSNIELDEFIVMPNHLHGIVWITESPARSKVNSGSGQQAARGYTWSLGAMIGGFKATVTKRINTQRDSRGVPVWQRSYHESIIRDKDELATVRQYILDNPAHWLEDDENPNRP
jgi:putative transposase